MASGDGTGRPRAAALARAAPGKPERKPPRGAHRPAAASAWGHRPHTAVPSLATTHLGGKQQKTKNGCTPSSLEKRAKARFFSRPRDRKAAARCIMGRGDLFFRCRHCPGTRNRVLAKSAASSGASRPSCPRRGAGPWKSQRNKAWPALPGPEAPRPTRCSGFWPWRGHWLLVLEFCPNFQREAMLTFPPPATRLPLQGLRGPVPEAQGDESAPARSRRGVC